MSYAELMGRVIDSITEVQVNHLKWKKVKNGFVQNTFERYELEGIFMEIYCILEELQFRPKMSIYRWLRKKLEDSSNFQDMIPIIFERRMPIFIPHNQHKYLRNRKMNLRSYVDYAIMSFFSKKNGTLGLSQGGLNLTGISSFIEENTQNYVLVFDIFSCFSSIRNVDILQFLKEKRTATTKGIDYARTILDNHLPMYMDNIIDKDLVYDYLSDLTERFINLDENADLRASLYGCNIGVDEIAFFIVSESELTGNYLQMLEKRLDRFLKQETDNRLFLNQTKSKILNSDNISDFKQEVVGLYDEHVAPRNILQEFCYTYPQISAEEILLKVKKQPTLFRYLNLQFAKGIYTEFARKAFGDVYKEIFKGVVYNDLQLFFEKIILENKHI